MKVKKIVGPSPVISGTGDKKNFPAGEDNVAFRELPHNHQAERAVLGALLSNNDAINRIADFLLSEHFFEPVHQRIYRSIQNCMERGIIATPITLKNFFDHDAALAEVGGAEYLIRLAGLSVAVINLESHAKVVYDLALKRNLVSLGEIIVNTAYDPLEEKTAQDQIEEAEQELFTLASEGQGERGFIPLQRSLTAAIERASLAYKKKDQLSGISTKFIDLDHILGGLQNSDLLILAGRPSMGKTALALNVALNTCKSLVEEHEKAMAQAPEDDQKQVCPSVGFFSLEMSAEQLASRMIAMDSGVNSSKMRSGNLSNDEFAKLVESNKRLYQLPFFIDDTPAITISALRTRARRLKRKNNLAVLFIDYLQLVRSSSKMGKENRVQEISEITQGLKAIAKELNIPVIALSQLSRAVEQREDKRPQLSDLRESGTIEQDSDIVMFIYREEYYEGRKEPPVDSDKYAEWQEKMARCMNKTDVIIAKQRNGPIGNVRLFFDSQTTSFQNLAEDDAVPVLPTH